MTAAVRGRAPRANIMTTLCAAGAAIMVSNSAVAFVPSAGWTASSAASSSAGSSRSAVVGGPATPRLANANANAASSAAFIFDRGTASGKDSSSRLRMSPDDPSRSDVESFRSLLESSWNPSEMGSVPTSPESAAKEAAASVKSAVESGGGKSSRVLLVDLQLPAFDVAQGPNVYDEVLATEFCTALADEMRDNGVARSSLVLLRDAGSAGDVGRVIEAKERKRREDEEYERARAGLAGLEAQDDDEDEGGDDNEAGEVEYFDDFADLGGGDEESGPAPAPASSDVGEGDGDIDSFRKQLMSSWDEGAEADEPAQTPAPEASSPAAPAPAPAAQSAPSPAPVPGSPRSYRLSSLFGSDAIDPSSPDMFSNAVESVDTNVDQSTTLEDAIIILSPNDPAELVAVRRLVQRYSSTKTIVLVNSRLDPIPVELIDAEVAYSIRPLVARAAPKSLNNPLRRDPTDKEREESVTKIVVMRRHPGEWELFVDGDGEGFELADTAPNAAIPREVKGGPGMEWVAGAMKRYMRDKFASS